ncbi:leucine-rich repeat-containing G-protein coupled receptor 4-like [Hylaeus anthracinus]|uniref:leucine-rich repeat-containing G-protein coupled receptor 4-like n=1 Tax=Hylaeus anthracinus TaxID=313031 RepID=UPI0023B997F6|nr:leucine-rich repeat-containing G-protein coupled receptor 4-like [Hylaeus anthracinus]
MNLLFTILAASIVPLLSATSVRIRSTESWIHGDHCNNDILSLRLSTSTIPRNFIASPSVRCVNISNNRLDSIEEGAFDQLPNLEYLNLQRHRIRPRNLMSFGNLTNIKKLILSDSEYYYAETIDVRGVYPQLQYLDLRNTRGSSIESSEENPFPELKYLDYSQNSIREINVINLNIHEKLTYLSLAMNDIQQLLLIKFSNLSFLNLDNNSIIEIGSSYNGVDLTGLTKLNYLSVANNRIRVIYRGAFRDTVNLRYLNISMTTLSTLDAETLYDLKSLEVLILDHNNFSAVPIMPTPMNLTTLSMKYNNVMNITNNSTNLPYLKTLFLSNNNIINIFPHTFESYEVLEELYLDGNQITSLPQGWCDSMKMLRLLDLSRNEFTVLESIFNSYVPSLQFIYIEDNPLEYIDTSTIEIIPKNVTIYFKHSVNRSIRLTKQNKL